MSLIKAVGAEGAVDAFDEGVLRQFAWLDAMQAHVVALRPRVQGPTGKLRAVVGDAAHLVGLTATHKFYYYWKKCAYEIFDFTRVPASITIYSKPVRASPKLPPRSPG